MPNIFEAGRQKYIRIRDWYEKYERHIGTASLFTGFVFDSLTLQRIDALRENLWIAGNLTIAALCIVLLNRKENNPETDESRQSSSIEALEKSKRHFWIFTILQFSFGSILGAFFIFYFQSSTLAVSWPFLLILVIAMVANELFQRRYARLVLQISFLYLSIYAFLIFIIPILTHRIGLGTFVLSGALSLVTIWLYSKILNTFAHERFRESRPYLVRTILIIFMGVNILYFTNLIPAIPLSLKDAGIYHQVSRNTSGTYIVYDEERRGFFHHFDLRKNINLQPGRGAYAYTAIYSPASLNTSIVHEWQYYDNNSGKWVTSTRVPLDLSGGRLRGFRTYSAKSNLFPGDWRVNVKTSRGQFIGRINFEIVSTDAPPSLEAIAKD